MLLDTVRTEMMGVVVEQLCAREEDTWALQLYGSRVKLDLVFLGSLIWNVSCTVEILCLQL